MLGLALEGGGARGAYHIGVYKAFAAAGYEFDVITGTSIGAINAAMLAQGSYEEAVEIWESMTNADIFDIEDKKFKKYFDGKMEVPDLAYYLDVIARVATDGGVATAKMVEMIDRIIDADKLLKSKINFGIVTVCVSDRKAEERFKGEMTAENIKSYIMASATFPGFQPTIIEGKHFIDGGVHDNCPMTMLVQSGCNQIIGVRTFGPGIYRFPKIRGVEVTIIEPSESLGAIMNFDPVVSKKNMQMGYYDACRYLEHLSGEKYYIEPVLSNLGFETFCKMSDEQILRAAAIMGVDKAMCPRRALFEKVLPQIAGEISLRKNASYTDLLIAMLENKAERAKIDRFCKFRFEEFVAVAALAEADAPIVKVLPILQSAKLKAISALDELIQAIHENLETEEKIKVDN